MALCRTCHGIIPCHCHLTSGEASMTKPWTDYLPGVAVRECLSEVLQAIEAGAPLEPLIASWRATAEAYSDSDLYKKLTTAIEDE